MIKIVILEDVRTVAQNWHMVRKGGGRVADGWILQEEMDDENQGLLKGGNPFILEIWHTKACLWEQSAACEYIC